MKSKPNPELFRDLNSAEVMRNHETSLHPYDKDEAAEVRKLFTPLPTVATTQSEAYYAN